MDSGEACHRVMDSDSQVCSLTVFLSDKKKKMSPVLSLADPNDVVENLIHSYVLEP